VLLKFKEDENFDLRNIFSGLKFEADLSTNRQAQKLGKRRHYAKAPRYRSSLKPYTAQQLIGYSSTIKKQPENRLFATPAWPDSKHPGRPRI